MPISREEFERGSISRLALVLSFLLSNLNMAFTAPEILQALGQQVAMSLEQVREALQTLVEEGKLETKDIEGTVYYIAKQITRPPLGFRPQGG